MSATAGRRRAAPRSRDPLAAMRTAFERHLAATLHAHAAPAGPIGAAVRYAALSPGKRIRPLLVLCACDALGGRWREALPAAAAIECVHAFSLVHDDLPAMDDDDYRRGRLTTHRKFGEAVGVLAGDALLAFAFEELTRLPLARREPARALFAVHTLAMASGAHALIQGQALDIAAEGRRATRIRVRDIHLRKTGALMGAALALGAIVAGATATTIRNASEAGLELGLAFQIHDDLLNAGSSLARLGKRAGTDAARGKATYPRAVGAARARAEADALLAGARRRVEALARRPARLLALIDALAARRH